MTTLFLAGLTLAGALAGCASTAPQAPPPPVEAAPSGVVDGDVIDPASTDRMQLGSNQIYIAGELSNPEVMPVYPPALLPLRLPDQNVCVRFAVAPDGHVSNIVPVFGIDGCPADAAGVRPEFVAAVNDAVSRWDFFSSIRCTFPTGTPDKQKCNGPGAVTEQVAVTLAYRFAFTARDGVGNVQRTTTNPGP